MGQETSRVHNLCTNAFRHVRDALERHVVLIFAGTVLFFRFHAS